MFVVHCCCGCFKMQAMSRSELLLGRHEEGAENPGRPYCRARLVAWEWCLTRPAVSPQPSTYVDTPRSVTVYIAYTLSQRIVVTITYTGEFPTYNNSNNIMYT